MSWQLVSFLILGAVLLAGFAWYERSRPPSQVVALVAALAALAVAGRVALAPLPNVKPLTTDVVVFAGYALGGAPGFAVGALAALVSNFWFGQGPWTPWQMAGWGLCGILGAALALGVRNAGRLSLAATCGLAAVLYGALLNFSFMATYGGELSLRYFGVLEARALPFEIAHAGGNVAFALVAGPAMVRMLSRFRERFQWRRGRAEAPRPHPADDDRDTGPEGARPRRALRAGGVAAVLMVALALGGLSPAPAHAAAASGASRASAFWLRLAQNEDGGFGASPGKSSSTEVTCWAMLALAAAGENPLDASRDGNTPVDFLRSHLDQVSSPGDYARTILALEASGVDPRRFGGRNLVSKLLARRRKDGSYVGWPNSTAFAVIALKAVGATGGLEATRAWLRSVQNEDGGWGDVPGSPSNPDATGAVMQALSPGSKAVNRAVDYLRSHQRKGGGFALGGSGPVNTPSTAWAVQGLIAAGRDPASFRRGGASALDYLKSNQASDGHYDYAQPSGQVSDEVAHQTPTWVTAEVAPAAAGATFPILAPPRAPKPKAPSQTSPATSSPPSTTGAPVTPTVPLPGIEPAPASPSGSGSGSGSSGSGSRSGGSASPGQQTPKAPAESSSPRGQAGEGPGASAPEPPASQPSTDSSPSNGSGGDSSPAGSILLGLLAGALLFGAAWAGRRGWVRWRYGL